jgi:hypothetical protein
VTKLEAAAGSVWALDVVALALMVRNLSAAELDPVARVLANGVALSTGAWIAVVGLVLALSWRRSSRVGLWVALVGAALPLLWAWSMTVQTISEWTAAPQ